MADNKMLFVYNITERDDKSYWNKIGVAFTNKDGSINLILDSIPISGKMQVREKFEDREEGTAKDNGKSVSKSESRAR